MTKFCPSCGAMLSENSEFCQGCGAKLDEFDFIPKAKDKEGGEEAPAAAEEKKDETPPAADEDKPAEDEEKPAAPETPKCGKCAKDAAWIPDYKRWYCNDCKEYLPKDTPPPVEGESTAKKEKGIISEIEEAVDDVVKTVEDELGDKVICPKCDKKADYIKEYSRYYCHDCKEYIKVDDAPKKEGAPAPADEAEKKEEEPAPAAEEKKEEEPAPEGEKKEEEGGTPKCTKCSKDGTWVKEYNRWYCYDCSDYLSKDLAPPAEAGEEKKEEEPAPPEEKKEEEPAPAAEEKKEEEPAPEEEKKEEEGGTPKCTKCSKDGTWVKEYNRWYCYDCSDYLSKDLAPPADAGEEKTSAEPEAQPVSESKDSEKEEPAPEKKEEEPAPAAEEKKEEPAPDASEPICPKCSKAGSWIEDYKRWYCNDCKEYLAKDLPPPGAAKDSAAPESAADPTEPAPAEEAPAEEKKEEDAPPTPVCPKCSKAGSWIPDYKRWYCNDCKEYLAKDLPPPRDAKEEAPAEEKTEDSAAPEGAADPSEQAPAEEPAPAEEKKEDDAPETPNCPKCSKPGTWVEDYGRFYCYGCETYLPKEGAAEPAPPEGDPPKGEPAPVEEKKDEPAPVAAPNCPKCSKPSNYIDQYKRYYCNDCKDYLPKDTAPAPAAAEPPPAPAEPAPNPPPKNKEEVWEVS